MSAWPACEATATTRGTVNDRRLSRPPPPDRAARSPATSAAQSAAAHGASGAAGPAAVGLAAGGWPHSQVRTQGPLATRAAARVQDHRKSAAQRSGARPAVPASEARRRIPRRASSQAWAARAAGPAPQQTTWTRAPARAHAHATCGAHTRSPHRRSTTTTRCAPGPSWHAVAVHPPSRKPSASVASCQGVTGPVPATGRAAGATTSAAGVATNAATADPATAEPTRARTRTARPESAMSGRVWARWAASSGAWRSRCGRARVP